MDVQISRRALAQSAIGLTVPRAVLAQPKVARLPGAHVRIALNSYSFDRPLRDGSLTLSDVVHYCARHGIEALDATGYYFPGYPQAPPGDYIRNLKREALVNGVTVFGTGVRNDFSVPDAAARKRDVQLVKAWIEVAATLGASVIRVFSGRGVPAGYSFDQVLDWMVPDLRECVAYGQSHGVVVGLQNHNDFLKTAAETVRLVNAVNSEWFGIVLDVGSLRQGDPYAEIEQLVPYAVSWQLKENVGYGDKETPTDLGRLKAIIDRAGYRGFLPIETLGPGDPAVKVAKFLAEVRSVFAG
ncbi:MAG: sugar phosphate isomerase/epimerase [Bryobacteraceae bacterium]|nr:sugar phosphate isomerase/epimerase [Bryobacteraceae bacterium]